MTTFRVQKVVINKFVVKAFVLELRIFCMAKFKILLVKNSKGILKKMFVEILIDNIYIY